MFHVGVTGTRNGMSDSQRRDVLALLIHTPRPAALHHGDCVGVDVQVAEMAKEEGFLVVCHPPSDPKLRAWHSSHEIRDVKTYFARNRDIVDVSQLLIVVPMESERQTRGGTWYTHNYAIKRGVPVEVVFTRQLEG